MPVNVVLLAVGANTSGTYGSADQTLKMIRTLLSERDIRIVSASRIYSTSPVGNGLQPRYFNGVLAVSCPYAPGQLLRHLKVIERKAGRRLGRHWGPRPLDLDIIGFSGRVLSWSAGRHRPPGRVILPHPEMHRRAFVLVPLCDVAPHWRHPVFGRSAQDLLKSLKVRRNSIQPVVDFST
jgi:2-amino-4-hydroxy-6-hydroxymethyldihydropteridine diphosphokinase